MGCDLCGKETTLYQTRVEGAVMTVCASCARHGTVIKQIPSAKEIEKKKKEKDAPTQFSPSSTPQEKMLLVVPDYAKRVKAAREKLGVKQEDLAKTLKIKESQLTKFENGQHMPDLETARMLEKALRIKLVEEYTEEHKGTTARNAGPLTLGDFVKTRKKS